ncbi:phage tail protein [Streptococcus pasteurianus]|uniref:phage tail protein n=1 Tax=Streptococcus pasteurianus TaxID=197614 RepID=UPI0022DF3E25|nr:phage tail protein [Streptococcus pasteurianus]
MITFLNEKDVEHGALASIKITNAVNGERSLSGEIESGDYVLENIERGWRLRFDDEYYAVTYAKPVDEGTSTHVTFDAVHQFFWDFDKSSVHEQLNDGSHTFVTYLDFIFKDSGYTYTIEPLLKVYAFEKQSFGYKSRLKLFNDIITSSGVEFQVNGKVVRILEKTGTDLSTVVRKNFNMNELGIEKNISDFVTYQKGFGAWVDENDHNKGRLTVEYTSPLASVYGKLEAEPLVDERYTKADSMTAALKENVDNSYSISITLDMEDLTRAGYDYTQPTAGDYIMAINETLGFKEKIRIVSFTSEYDITGQLVKHEVTCNDIGAVKKLSASYTLAKEQAQNASDSIAQAVETANKALVSADGKSTVYFGNEFPKDEPKGTLHKGDSLYLTVGDTTKMYYWTGADWEELPIVNDVEAFKEQIADELKDVPDREEFEATITEKLATSKAELETQIDTAKTQAETNAKTYADAINQATAEVAEQANTTANSLKSDLAKVKTDLTATTSTANDAKTSASEAKQQLTTVANDLSKAKQDLTSQAQQLQAQASAQSELTKRVSSVEETANGTKTTVSELSKTVDSNTKNITSVTARTKVVEYDLTSTKTTLSQVKTTADSTSQKTATLETGLNGVKADLTATTTTANTTKTNLANYQASNDKAVANLQSNLQTANGNISSLQTKVEAVPGQITSAVSAVEGKIPTEIGSSNLLRNTAVNADNLKIFGTSNSTISIVTKDGHQTYKIVVSATNNSGVVFNGNAQYYNLIKDRSYTFSFWVLTNKDKSYSFESLGHIQVCNGNGDQVGNDIAHQHTTPVYSTNTIKANTWTKVWCTFKATSNSYFKPYFWYLKTGDEIYIYDMMLNEGKIPLSYTPAVEDTQSDITKLNTTLTQTANGLKQLSTQVTSQGSTITSHTNSINSLTTGLSAKVSQTDFNTLSGRVTTAENNITAKANELSSKITSVEGKIPTSVGGRNLLTKTNQGAIGWDWIMQVGDRTVESLNSDGVNAVKLSKGRTTTQSGYSSILFKNVLTTLITTNTQYTLSFDVYPNVYTTFNATIMDSDSSDRLTTVATMNAAAANKWTKVSCILTRLQNSPANIGGQVVYLTGMSSANSASYIIKNIKLEKGNILTDWTPAPEDYDSKLATAQSEIKQTTDSIKASVSALDKSTVKSASLTINTDGIVMKAGKSTTDVANAIGSYFAVNQNAINLFSDKINVKGSMIVDGAITSTKIASKSINTAHLNGKIITADVISSNAITADAIKAGSVTTDKMTANSINGDRITAGTLDAAKIKAGSITASQIASGTITSAQIKTGTISAANIAAGAITTDKIAANSINSSKIVSSGITANVIKGGKLQSLSNATNFELDTGKLFYNNNNTGIFRVQANASTMGLKFSNTSITVSGTSRILSRVILGGDRREITLDDGKWDQGGFSGIVVETINGIAANDHERADSLRVIADNIYFGHSYNKDVVTNTSAAGWKMETYPPTSTFPSHVVLRPYGISYRNADIITGDVRLDNGDGSGYYVRSCIQILRNCFQHIINGGTSSDAINAIRSAISQISGV